MSNVKNFPAKKEEMTTEERNLWLDRVFSEILHLNDLQVESLDRLRNAQDSFQLEKAKALVDFVQWKTDRFEPDMVI